MNDDKIKSLLARYRMEDFPFADVEAKLTQAVKDSGIFKLYAKKSDATLRGRRGIGLERNIQRIIIPDQAIGELISRREN